MFKKIAIVASVVIFMTPFATRAIVTCGSLGGDCYLTDCSGSDATTNKALVSAPTGNGGCVAAYGEKYVCCTQSAADGDGAKKSGAVDSTAKGSGLLPTPGDKTHTTVPSGLPSNTNVGNYQINDLLVLGKNVSNWILGMVGSAALLMFIWGGFQWLTSQGESAKVAEGKKIMTAAVIGLIIVFSSYIMIKFVVVDVLNMSWEGGYVKSK